LAKTDEENIPVLLYEMAGSQLIDLSIMKLMKVQPVIDVTTPLGYPETVIRPLGFILLIGALLYVLSSTSVLGAIFLTGYLGGAIATRVRVGNPLFSHALFPVYLALLLWGGLYLHDMRLRELIPLRKR
jgi:hypothetical protein